MKVNCDSLWGFKKHQSTSYFKKSESNFLTGQAFLYPIFVEKVIYWVYQRKKKWTSDVSSIECVYSLIYTKEAFFFVVHFLPFKIEGIKN